MKRMNSLCPCRKAGAWSTKKAAKRRLQWIHENPDPERLYSPVRVDQCRHGVWHLSSKSAKQYRKGKGKSDRNTRRRRNI